MNSFLKFETFEELESFINSNDTIKNWVIVDDKLDKKVELLKQREYFKHLRNIFKSNNSRFKANIQTSTIITILDTIHIIYRVLSSSKLDKSIRENIKIVVELTVPFFYNKRVDMLLFMENKIILLEFGYTYLDRPSSQYVSQKLVQAIEYKEMIGSLLDKNTTISVFPYIYVPEVKSKTKTINELFEQQLDVFIKYLNVSYSGKSETSFAYDSFKHNIDKCDDILDTDLNVWYCYKVETNTLVEDFKKLRSTLTKINNYKANYMIFNDKTIEMIVELKPQTIEELYNIYGLGETKIERYGNFILSLLETGDDTIST